MADLKGSTASAIAAVTATTRLLASDSSTDGYASGAQIAAYLGNGIRNQSTADQSPTAATLTYLTGSALAVPAGGLRVGTVLRWRLALSKTAFGSAARSFHIRVGTLGTTSDTAVATITQSSLPTAAADDGCIEIVGIVRAIGASATIQWQHVLVHNGNTTGLAAIPIHVLKGLSSTFNSTTASLIVGLSVTTGASEVLTFQEVIAEAKNL